MDNEVILEEIPFPLDSEGPRKEYDEMCQKLMSQGEMFSWDTLKAFVESVNEKYPDLLKDHKAVRVTDEVGTMEGIDIRPIPYQVSKADGEEVYTYVS